jgi:hypothetical protein
VITLQRAQAAATRRLPTYIDRTVVIGDIHGDLDSLLYSLADKGLIRYNGQFQQVLRAINQCVNTDSVASLQRLVIDQPADVRLIFLGDLLDRFEFGYHAIQFLKSVDWTKARIFPVFILGNHDVHNLQFFVNPYKIHQLYQESEHSLDNRMKYIGEMGLLRSLWSFFDLHEKEIRALQTTFYQNSELTFDLPYGAFTLKYKKDLSSLLGYRGQSYSDARQFWISVSEKLKIELPGRERKFYWAFLEGLKEFENPNQDINFWNINPPLLQRGQSWRKGFDDRIATFNCFRDPIKEAVSNICKNMLLVDWRVISMVWRKHYGDFFRSCSLVFAENEHLYVHGGLSPQMLIDSQGFGSLYRIAEGSFVDLAHHRQYRLQALVNRANRLTHQLLTNALNDYSFATMAGTEITDLLGMWRGGQYSFTQFGGFYWSDFEYLRQELNNPRILDLYRKFVATTGLKRVVCGHTRFRDTEDGNTRYLRLEKFEEIGLDYLCVDNSCSRGYRQESHALLNGIEILANGTIPDRGKYRTK